MTATFEKSTPTPDYNPEVSEATRKRLGETTTYIVTSQPIAETDAASAQQTVAEELLANLQLDESGAGESHVVRGYD